MLYHNYHKHDHKGNAKQPDSVAKEVDYCKRAKELGHTKYFTCNHGYQGDVYTSYSLCQEYGLQLVINAEVYYVEDRFKKDRRNYHMIIVAKNDDGVRDLNYILSESNQTGFYYKNRIDDKLLFSINPNNVIITTACCGGRLRDEEGLDEWLIKMKNHFKDNFFLEVQPHVHIHQANYNRKVLEKSKLHDIKIIHANDSHYIYPSDARYRDLLLKYKGIVYEEEEGFILDYPDTDTIIDRYKKQNVLNEEQIIEAIKNTLVFDECEELSIINYDIKLPPISDNPNKELKQILNKEWAKTKNSVPKEKWEHYQNEIKYEMDIVEKTKMENYFILDYKIVKRAIEKYNGLLTKTGRGSAVSFYINKLLGLTEIDRINSPVPLYPTRFMSIERILGTKSLPDIDLNAEDSEPFIQATKDILGEENCAWMMSYTTYQDSGAFRLLCKAKGLKHEEYNEIAKDLDKYKNTEQWKDLIEESKVFIGVVESVAPSPCSMVLYDKPVNREIGLIKIGDVMCCNLDGYNCDKYKYLKNDYLTVKVYHLIRKTCEMANIPIPSITELEQSLDQKTFDIYKNKLTSTINQVDSEFATNLVSKYTINSVAEMSAFVAAIRPGFASLLNNFIDRKAYSTGVEELDNILKDSYHYLMYQESIMKYLIWLGIKESESYDIIKKIAKKKFKEDELRELKHKLKSGWMNKVGKMEGFEETWQVVEDAAAYSFNASHSLSYAYDSLYVAYLKSHYPFEYYSVALNLYKGDIDRTTRLVEELKYFDIKLENPKFRYSKDIYFFDKESSSIFKGVESIKYLNKEVGEYLYSLRYKKYTSFIELLDDIKGVVNSRQLDILIELDYFSEFGKSQKLMDIVELYNTIYTKKQFKKDSLPCDIEIMRKYAATETEKIFKDVDKQGICKYIENIIEDVDLPIQQRIKSWIENTGSCNLIDETQPRKNAIVIDINTKYKTPKIKLYNLYSGKTAEVKIGARLWREYKLELFDMITIVKTNAKFKKKKFDNKWIETDEKEYWLEDYIICK